MKIEWMGHACFVITSKDGTIIVTDPYEPNAFGGQLAYKPVKVKADIVTISHDHADHNYTKTLAGSFDVVRDAGIFKGIKFEAVKVAHDPQGGSQRGKNTIFIFEVDGIKIAHLGDLGHVLTDEQAAKLKGVDVMLIPVGGFFTIDAKEADAVVAKVAPKIVIPMHVKNKGCKFDIAPIEKFLEGKKYERKNTTFVELKKEELPNQTQIIVLEPAMLP